MVRHDFLLCVMFPLLLYALIPSVSLPITVSFGSNMFKVCLNVPHATSPNAMQGTWTP